MASFSKIKVLPDTVINKIAAGEVIERPSSVVKELVENAIDAAATRIFVEVRNGGRDLIRVIDNGNGMSRDDALLAFERHATSKIKQFEDLEEIGTFGFRGEAVPSIAAVSKVLMTTAEREGQTGTEVSVAGGDVINVRDVLREPGTTFEIQQLFYNVPVRRKFLKAELTELSHITDIVTNLALANTDIQFRLLSNGRLVLDFMAHETFKDRVFKVVGSEEVSQLLGFTYTEKDIFLEGYISKPSAARIGRRHQKLFLNRRFIRDKLISSAIFQAYRNTIADDRQPIVFLALTIPPQQVDVNVHPTKTEVRFVNSTEVYNIVLHGIQHALYESMEKATAPVTAFSGQSGVSAQKEHLQSILQSGVINQPIDSIPHVHSTVIQKQLPLKLSPPSHEQPVTSLSPERVAVHNENQAMLDDTSVPTVIGQLNNTFILLDNNGELLIIDQHTAHERILFEAFSQLRQQAKLEMQKLLIPITFDLSPRDAHLLNQWLETFRAFGYEVDPFGPHSFVLSGVPSIINNHDHIALIRDMIDELSDVTATSGTKSHIDAIVKMMACKAAVKANQHLSLDSMQQLINQLYHTQSPDTCPHGRPIIMHIRLNEIYKYFRR